MIEYIEVNKLQENPNNPRVIKDNKFNQLVNSIREFPKMLELRPIVVDDNYVVLGGNMRLKAITEAGFTHTPYIKATDLTEAQKKEFIIKDNVGYGEWDWDIITAEWDTELLEEWGMDVIQHDWSELEYIEDEQERAENNKDTRFIVTIGVAYEDVRQQIRDSIEDLLNDKYPGCEIK